jgi:release factor glutamine methyltransferase
LGATVKFLHGNLLEPIPDPLGLVLANPPYVDPAVKPELQRELGFEPSMALFADDRGMALGTEILRQARRRRAPAVVLEIGDRQGPEMKERALIQGWKRVMVHQDMAGFDRVLVAVS